MTAAKVPVDIAENDDAAIPTKVVTRDACAVHHLFDDGVEVYGFHQSVTAEVSISSLPR